MADFGWLFALPVGVVMTVGAVILTLVSRAALARARPEDRPLARLRAAAAMVLLAALAGLWVWLAVALLTG